MKFRLGGRTICLCECLIVEVPLDGARAHATLKPRHRHQPQSLPRPPPLSSRLIYIVNYSCSIVCVCSGSLAWKHLSVIVSFHRRRPSSFMIYLSQFDLCTHSYIRAYPAWLCLCASAICCTITTTTTTTKMLRISEIRYWDILLSI